MHCHSKAADLQQLLKRGYSADDLRTLHAPATEIEKAVSQYREELRQRALQRQLHSQANYAMRLARR